MCLSTKGPFTKYVTVFGESFKLIKTMRLQNVKLLGFLHGVGASKRLIREISFPFNILTISRWMLRL